MMGSRVVPLLLGSDRGYHISYGCGKEASIDQNAKIFFECRNHDREESRTCIDWTGGE